MKISINNNEMFKRFGYKKGLEILKNAGFDCCDYTFYSTGDTGYNKMFAGENYLEIAKDIRKCADETGIIINQAHAPFPSNVEGDDKRTAEIFETIVRSIEAAGIMGAKCIVVHPMKFSDHATHYEENLAFYKSLIPYAEKAGVKIGVENMWGYDNKRGFICKDAFSDVNEIKKIVSELGKWATCCLDLGHSNLAGYEAADDIKILGDVLGALHVHDTNYKEDWHQLPFQGEHNWKEICSALKQIGYKGDFTLEVDRFLMYVPDEIFESSVKYMADVAKYLAGECE